MNQKIQEQDYDIEVLDIKLLKPYANNPRQTNQAAIDKVIKSIEQNQFSSVIVVDKNYEIIAGHTRLAAAQQIGLTGGAPSAILPARYHTRILKAMTVLQQRWKARKVQSQRCGKDFPSPHRK